MNDRERFIASMEYEPADRVPNHELGIWPQTRDRWLSEGMPPDAMTFDWFRAEPYIGLDRREYISINFEMIPLFQREVIEETDRYEIVRNHLGVVTKALKDGTVGGGRMCMDQYVSFPVTDLASFREIKKRYAAGLEERYPADWKTQLLPEWKNRDYPLVLGQNCQAKGFYWRAREWMGTENLSYAWYDQPDLAHEMMEFFADYVIEMAKPILAETDVDYFCLNEDFAMKTGPLLSPETFRTFVFGHLKRLVEFMKSHGVRYIALDSDGNPEVLIPMLMDAGVDVIWPLERAADMNPVRLRRKFGKSLRLWGGVDKRELAKDKSAIDAHLAELAPLVEEGGFIPTVDHTVPPDVSWENFIYYMQKKREMLGLE